MTSMHSVVVTTNGGSVKAVDRSKLEDVRLAPTTTAAVPAGNPPDLTPLCSLYDNGAKAINVTVREGEGYATSEARSIVDKIGAQIGMQSVPEAVEGNVPNAMATFYGQHRVIVYNSAFMDQVAKQSGTRWAYVGILAHELGHHLNFHIASRSTADSWHQELQADYFSGLALAKLGATLPEAQAAMKTLEAMYGPGGSTTHPPTKMRLQEIEKGFRDGGSPPSANTKATNGDAPSTTPPSPPVPAPPVTPGPSPTPPQTQPVSVGFMLNGNVALRAQFFVDGVLVGELTNVASAGIATGTVPMAPGSHQLAVRGVAQSCNQVGCGTPFPVSGGPSPFEAAVGVVYLVTGALSPQGFAFALNRTQ